MRRSGHPLAARSPVVEGRASYTRLADGLLRRTIDERGLVGLIGERPGLVVMHGVRRGDGPCLAQAIQHLFTDGSNYPIMLGTDVVDWTLSNRPRWTDVQTLLLDVAIARYPLFVLCGGRSTVPPLVAAVADAVVAIADRQAEIARLVEEIVGIDPDRDLVGRLARLDFLHLHFVLRPGLSRGAMLSLVRRLRRHAADRDDGSGGKRPRTSTARHDPRRVHGRDDRDARPSRLEDMHGMGEARDWGLELARDLADYREGKLGWSEIDGGVLLHGPPGTGKTSFANALAGSCEVPLHAHSFAAWQARGHLGDLLKGMRAAFDEARKAAPSILFVDELDSVGSRDEALGEHASYQRQVVNGFLECLDGTLGRPGVVVIGATNRRAAIDPAVLRPGRLGRHIEVGLPDLQGRIGILRHHLRGDLAGFDVGGLADEIGEAPGSTLAQIVREARAIARRERRPLRAADLDAALPKGTILVEDTFRRLCVHEAGHVVVGIELAHASGVVPARATVRRRVRSDKDHRTEFAAIEGFDMTRASIEARVTVMLAGLAAEEVLVGVRGGGSGGAPDSDLVRATRLVAAAERSLGLGGGLISVPLERADTPMPALDDPAVRQRVDQTLVRCLREAKRIIERRREEVEAVAKRLAERSTLDLAGETHSHRLGDGGHGGVG